MAANALSPTETPAAPPPGMTNALTSGASQMPQAAPGGSSQPSPQAMPASPTHAQTVAALRHFDAVRKELAIIAKDPALGKSSVKGKIIDGVTRLVSTRFMQPSEAVTELAKVPTEPLAQMKWVKNMLAQARAAEQSILAHHAIGFAGGGPAPTPPADDHADQMAAVMNNFKGAGGG